MSKRQFLEDMVQSIMENKIDDARQSFRQFTIESAREIHASLIENDELEDDIDDAGETVEESFEEVVEAGDESEDFGAGVDVEVDGGEEIGDVDGDVEVAGEEEGTVEVEVNELEELKAKLAELQAKFEEATGLVVDSAAEEAGEEEAVVGDEEGFEAPAEEENVEESNDFDLTEEDLLGLEEGWTEVKVTMDGGELDGKFAGGEKNTKTPVATKTEGQVDAKDLVSKQDAHKGYAKENAPAAPKHNDADNAMASGKKAWTGVTAKMDGQEQGGGKFATPEKSKTTPVAKK